MLSLVFLLCAGGTLARSDTALFATCYSQMATMSASALERQMNKRVLVVALNDRGACLTIQCGEKMRFRKVWDMCMELTSGDSASTGDERKADVNTKCLWAIRENPVGFASQSNGIFASNVMPRSFDRVWSFVSPGPDFSTHGLLFLFMSKIPTRCHPCEYVILGGVRDAAVAAVATSTVTGARVVATSVPVSPSTRTPAAFSPVPSSSVSTSSNTGAGAGSSSGLGFGSGSGSSSAPASAVSGPAPIIPAAAAAKGILEVIKDLNAKSVARREHHVHRVRPDEDLDVVMSAASPLESRNDGGTSDDSKRSGKEAKVDIIDSTETSEIVSGQKESKGHLPVTSRDLGGVGKEAKIRTTEQTSDEKFPSLDHIDLFALNDLSDNDFDRRMHDVVSRHIETTDQQLGEIDRVPSLTAATNATTPLSSKPSASTESAGAQGLAAFLKTLEVPSVSEFITGAGGSGTGASSGSSGGTKRKRVDDDKDKDEDNRDNRGIGKKIQAPSGQIPDGDAYKDADGSNRSAKKPRLAGPAQPSTVRSVSFVAESKGGSSQNAKSEQRTAVAVALGEDIDLAGKEAAQSRRTPSVFVSGEIKLLDLDPAAAEPLSGASFTKLQSQIRFEALTAESLMRLTKRADSAIPPFSAWIVVRKDVMYKDVLRNVADSPIAPFFIVEAQPVPQTNTRIGRGYLVSFDTRSCLYAKRSNSLMQYHVSHVMGCIGQLPPAANALLPHVLFVNFIIQRFLDTGAAYVIPVERKARTVVRSKKPTAAGSETVLGQDLMSALHQKAMDTVAAASSSNAISLVPSILSMAPRSRVPPPVLVAPSSSSQSLTSLAHAPTPPDWTPMSAAAAVAASRYLAGAPPTTKSSEMKIAAVASATAAAASLGSDVSSLMSNLASLPAASKQATATTAIQPGRSMLLRGSSGSGSGSGSGFSHGATLVASPAQAKTKSSHLGSGSGSNLVNATPQVRTKPLVLASKVIKS
jgi:hypothetical protein